jgi:uncharacterized membrane protein
MTVDDHAVCVTTAHPVDGDAGKAVEETALQQTPTEPERHGNMSTNQLQNDVIAVSFEEDELAYAALARIKKLDSEGQIELLAATVVTRDAEGRVVTKDTAGKEAMEGTAVGGVIGLLVGILGGPLGVLIGGATGVLVGSLFDLEETDNTDSVLAALSQEVRPGHNTLLAELWEPSDHQLVDAVIESRSGNVLRRPVWDVEAEIAAAEKAQREARKRAREELRRQREEKHKAQVEAKVTELKAKLPGRREKAPAGASS